jgi:hypothetical protein
VERNQVLAEVIRPLAVSLLVVLAGCSAGTTGGTTDNLTARLTSPTDITLTWHPTDTGAAGQIVEYTNEPQGEYTILGYLPPTRTTYEHPDLIPQTSFYYRVRPYFGAASTPVQVELPPGDFDESAPDDGEWAKPRTIPGPRAEKNSVRQPHSAPTELTPTIVNANGVRFTWVDHTDDEEGFLLEVKAAGSPDFTVAAVLDPDVTSFGLTTLPAEKKAVYRVRPYRFGLPTNVARQTTGAAAG